MAAIVQVSPRGSWMRNTDGAMTRRDFAGLLAFMLLGEVHNERTLRASDTKFEHHLQNRRLFNFAAGAIKLDNWERKHVHDCGICQTTARAFIQAAT